MDRVVNILQQIKITGDRYASNKLFFKLLQVIGDNTTDYGQPVKHHLKIICEMVRDSTILQSSTKSTVIDTGNSNFDLSEIIFQMSFWLTKFLHKISDDFTSDKSLLPAYYINIVAIYAAIILQLYKCERCISSTQECTHYNDKSMKRDGDQLLARHADHNVSKSCLYDQPNLNQANVVGQASGDAQIADVNQSTPLNDGSPVAGCSRYDNELSVANKATATSQSSTPMRSKKRLQQPSFISESSSDTSVDSIPVSATSALDSNKLVKHNKYYKQKRSSRADNRNTVQLNFDKDTTLTMNTTASNAKISFSVRHILSSPTEDNNNQEKLNIDSQLQESIKSDDCNVDNKQDNLQAVTIATSSNTNSDKSVIASSTDKSSSNLLTSHPIRNLSYAQDRNMSNLASPISSSMMTPSAQSGGANSQPLAVNMLPMAYCYQLPNVFPAPVYAPVQVQRTRENYPYFQMASSTSNKMYQCNICLKVFTRSYSLTRHKRIHTCERPYKCTACGKSFSQSYHLKIHVRIHSRDAES